jgi:hypothetical protein
VFKKEEKEKEEEQSREMRERCERDEIERSFFQQPHAVETSKNIVAAVAYSNVVHCRKFTYLLPLLCPCMFTRTSSTISNTKAKLGKKLNKILKLNINIIPFFQRSVCPAICAPSTQTTRGRKAGAYTIL